MCMLTISKGKIIDSEKNTWDINDVLPLVKTSFLGCNAYVPKNIKQVLIDYGDISIPKNK